MPNELTFEELKNLAGQLKEFGLKHIVFSGGEPLLRRDFKQICELFSGARKTLLTNGLLLEKRIDEFQNIFDEIIVSIDGADAETHNKIRGIKSFEIISEGIKKTLANNLNQIISIRTVIQKNNFRSLPAFIELAKSLGVARISFLAADVLSDAYGRDNRGAVSPNSELTLTQDETIEFRKIIKEVIVKYKNDFDSKFISESPDKLFHLVDYYEALLGVKPFPKNICNAPMVSAVITSKGDVHPCFFLPKQGNVRSEKLRRTLNTQPYKNIRQKVKSYDMERCKTCVCTLYVSSQNALRNNF